MIRGGASPFYLLGLVAVIGTMLGWLYATSETLEVLVRDKRVEQGELRRGRPVDVYVLLTDQGRLPISGLPLIGASDAGGVYAAVRSGQRYRMRITTSPWSGERAIIEIDP